MNKDEIDTMWQKAMQESIKDGEMYTRYHFAKLVAERALADPMREVQRLGQEIEQEPYCYVYKEHGEEFFAPRGGYYPADATPLYAHPPQRTEQEPVAFASHGVINWIAGKQFQHEADLYTTPPQRTEPSCPDCKAVVLYECVACSSNNYPPPQRTEQNFCSRCGKRTNDIHTCTPPQD